MLLRSSVPVNGVTKRGWWVFTANNSENLFVGYFSTSPVGDNAAILLVFFVVSKAKTKEKSGTWNTMTGQGRGW